MNKLKFFATALLVCIHFFVFSASAYAMIEVPGCRDAWNSISEVNQISSLETLIKTDCAILHRQGFRLPKDGGTYDPDICAPAWNQLIQAKKGESVKFLVTHNCPVFYRKGWEKCS
ncbi:MAG TPA: hypothetical protein DCF68_11255 [Cyanothece sp. UBA12306]|nr:hypothetical protein [Cyanothece sp. UBA12306]